MTEQRKPDAYYTAPELAQRYKVSLDTIRKWRVIGYGPKGVRMGKHVRFPRAEVERWERERLDDAEEDRS